MHIHIRPYSRADLSAMAEIWNEVVRQGEAFPQLETLEAQSAESFFTEQSHCTVAQEDKGSAILALYILHPNNVGRCGHIANASLAVSSTHRGCHIGEALVRDCLHRAKALGFRILQFNAVVAGNHGAQHLYEKLGRIPGGFFEYPRGIRGYYCLLPYSLRRMSVGTGA